MSRIVSRPIASVAFVAALSLLLLNAVRVAVQSPDDLFDSQVVQRIDLYINSDDWRALQTDSAARPYYPATLKWGTIVSRNVGVRSESAGAREARKPRLHIDASWYVSNATFLGLRSLTLDNLAEDPSAVRRTVTLRFYQWMDLPAPRAVHAALYVNNVFSGLYAVVEPVDRAMARYAAAHGQESGRLYRYSSSVPYQLNYLGTDLNGYQDLFRAEPEPAGFSSDDYAAIEAMIRALNSDVIAADERISTYLDVRQLMKIAAVQSFLGMSAGIAGREGLSDFSLHVRRRADAIQIVPNGESIGLENLNHPIGRALSGNVLTRSWVRLKPDSVPDMTASDGHAMPALFRMYIDALLASAAAADRHDGSVPPPLQAEVERQQRLIVDVVKSDALKPWSDREFKDASAAVARFARERSALVRCQVAAFLQQAAQCGAESATTADSGQRPVSDAVVLNRQTSTAAASPATNVARGHPYTLAPRPNYALTTDAGDDTQLTDGMYTAGTFWTHATTVGWTNAVPVTIVIDLGSTQSISGVSYSTAAGTAGVLWPRSIFVLVSDDGHRFYAAGDLAAQQRAQPPSTGYATFRFVRSDFKTHGRYVALIVDPTGSYTFCDEIEVLSGDPAWVRTPLSGESTSDLQAFFGDARTRASVQRRMAADLAAVRGGLESSPVSAAVRSRLNVELTAAENETAAIPTPAHDSFRAVLPLNATHARIYAVHGMIGQARGLPPLSAWVVNPWDFVRPLDDPPSAADGPGMLSIAAMTGETRSGAINFSNATGHSMKVALNLEGVSPGAGQSDLQLYQAIWTDTRELIPVADALVPMEDGAAAFDLPAGMTRQIWVSFMPVSRAPGTSRGRLEAISDDGLHISIPIELRVAAGTFPARQRLHLGGWDYTDADRINGLTPENKDALIRQLQLLKVDAPWARSVAMPAGTYDGAGHLNAFPDTAVFDQWVSRWPGASRYMVFVNVEDALGNVPVADSRFPTAAAEWIRFWTTHAAALGIQPAQLMLLLVDEPRSASQDERVVTWANAIKAGEPRVRIWEDPTYTDPAAAMPELLRVSDVLALKRSLMLQQGPPYVDFYRQRVAHGQSLDIYGASGPARLLDPYTYDRLQAWMCADIGASASLFWSFVDDAGGSSWNEYRATQTLYSPFFLSPDDVTISKHSEAIREGVEDFEYLAMLRDRVAVLSRTDPNGAGLARAVALLDSAAATVLGAPGATDLDWATDKDRSAADRMRLAIMDLFETLQLR